ncbi:MAG: transglycosylase SLT domain-containing protein, partial [archaeon]
ENDTIAKIIKNQGYMSDSEYETFLNKLAGITDFSDRINIISQNLSKVYANNKYAYLLLLRGQSYAGLAKLLFTPKPVDVLGIGLFVDEESINNKDIQNALLLSGFFMNYGGTNYLISAIDENSVKDYPYPLYVSPGISGDKDISNVQREYIAPFSIESGGEVISAISKPYFIDALEVSTENFSEIKTVSIKYYSTEDLNQEGVKQINGLSVSKITSISEDNDSYSIIELNLKFNASMIGAPVLDQSSKVIGMIVSGGDNTINVIPITFLTKSLFVGPLEYSEEENPSEEDEIINENKLTSSVIHINYRIFDKDICLKYYESDWHWNSDCSDTFFKISEVKNNSFYSDKGKINFVLSLENKNYLTGWNSILKYFSVATAVKDIHNEETSIDRDKTVTVDRSGSTTSLYFIHQNNTLDLGWYWTPNKNAKDQAIEWISVPGLKYVGEIIGYRELSPAEINQKLIHGLNKKNFEEGIALMFLDSENYEEDIGSVEESSSTETSQVSNNTSNTIPVTRLSKERQAIFDAIQRLNNKCADDSIIGDLDISIDGTANGVNCYDSVLYLYKEAGVGKECLYSDNPGTKYTIDGVEVSTSDDGSTAFMSASLNSPSCLNQNIDYDEKINLIKSGDILSVIWKVKGADNAEKDAPHNVIFVKWINKAEYTAQIFHWFGGSNTNCGRSWGYQEVSLSQDAFAVYKIDKPKESSILSQEDTASSGQDGDTNVVNVKFSDVVEYASKNSISNGNALKKCQCEDNCQNYSNLIYTYAALEGIDPILALALMMQESQCITDASSGSSTGLMQINCEIWWDEFNFNSIEECQSSLISNPEENIKRGLQILKVNYNLYNKGIDFDSCNRGVITYSDWDAALRAYNGLGCNNNYAEQDYFVDNVNTLYSNLASNFDEEDIASASTEYSVYSEGDTYYFEELIYDCSESNGITASVIVNKTYESCTVNPHKLKVYVIPEDTAGVFVLKADRTFVQNLFGTFADVFTSFKFQSGDPTLGYISIDKGNLIYDKTDLFTEFFTRLSINEEKLVKEFRYSYESKNVDSEVWNKVDEASRVDLNNGFKDAHCGCVNKYECMDYAYFLDKYSTIYKLNYQIPFALILQETECNQELVSVSSAYGAMQVTSDTFNDHCSSVLSSFKDIQGVDNLGNNIHCGIRILKDKY